MGTFISLIILSFLIFFHELGHFLAARFFGVKVEVFSIGFGQKIFKKMHKGTEYALSLIPLGGYVKMKGQDDLDPKKVSLDFDSYNSKNPFERIVILFAGPFANFVLAFLLFLALAFLGVSKLAPEIGEIAKDSPAQIAGFEPKDVIVAINDREIKIWDELSEEIKNSQGTLTFVIKRANNYKKIIVNPHISEAKTMFGETIQKRMVGISPSGGKIEIEFGFFEAFGYAFDETINSATLIVQSLQKLVEGVIPAKEMGGVISIVSLTSDASSNISALLFLTALISVNLGVLNLLPIPALDGGHIAFNIYEIIARKKPNEEIMYRLTMVGWVFLLSLMAFTIFNDISRLIG